MYLKYTLCQYKIPCVILVTKIPLKYDLQQVPNILDKYCY